MLAAGYRVQATLYDDTIKLHREITRGSVDGIDAENPRD